MAISAPALRLLPRAAVSFVAGLVLGGGLWLLTSSPEPRPGPPAAPWESPSADSPLTTPAGNGDPESVPTRTTARIPEREKAVVSEWVRVFGEEPEGKDLAFLVSLLSYADWINASEGTVRGIVGEVEASIVALNLRTPLPWRTRFDYQVLGFARDGATGSVNGTQGDMTPNPTAEVEVECGRIGKALRPEDLQLLAEWWGQRRVEHRKSRLRSFEGLVSLAGAGKLERLDLSGASGYVVKRNGVYLVPRGADPELDRLLMELDRFDGATDLELDRRLEREAGRR